MSLATLVHLFGSALSVYRTLSSWNKWIDQFRTNRRKSVYEQTWSETLSSWRTSLSSVETALATLEAVHTYITLQSITRRITSQSSLKPFAESDRRNLLQRRLQQRSQRILRSLLGRGWLDAVTVKAPGFPANGRGFAHYRVTTLGKLFTVHTHVSQSLCHQCDFVCLGTGQGAAAQTWVVALNMA